MDWFNKRKIALVILFICVSIGNALSVRAQYSTIISLNSGDKLAFRNSDINNLTIVPENSQSSFVASPLQVDYNWQLGGINASTGEIYYRSVRVYSDLIRVEEGDVIKTEGFPYVVVFYNPIDSSWVKSDFSTNGFRTRNYLFKENSLVRLLVAKPDFSDFGKDLSPKVWIQHGGYEPQIKAQVHWPKLFNGKFDLEAHRGISDEFPENSLIAFQEAAKVKIYKGIETDAQITKDGVLVCMHDNTIDRTTNGSGKVEDYTFKELQQFFIDGGNGWDSKYANSLKIPTLAEYLDVCKSSGKVPYVELKLLTFEGIKKVVQLLHDKGFEDGSYILTSFTLDYLLYASTICDSPLEFMKSSFSEAEIGKYTHLRNIILRPDSKNVTEKFVKMVNMHNVSVEAYGVPVGNANCISNFLKWGVEGATCNSWKNLGLD